MIYEGYTAGQKAILFAAAKSRGDEGEAQAILDSCTLYELACVYEALKQIEETLAREEVI